MLFSNIEKDRELSLYLIECMNKPFQWGVHDCCIFSVRWIEKITGNKYLPDVSPWNSALSAMRYIKENYNTLEEKLDSELEQINCNFAVDGDVTVVDGTMFIFSNNYIVSVGYHGLDMLPRSKAKKAWRVKLKRD